MKSYHIISFLSLLACNSQEEVQQKIHRSLSSDIENMYYYKDNRTNLCFSMLDRGYGGPTNVPCTPEVENLIKQQQSAK